MSKSIYTLKEFVLLGGCDDPVVEQALRIAAREFCRRTSVWRDEITATLAYNDTDTTLTMDPTIDGIFLRLVSVWINDGSGTDKNLSSRRFNLAADGTLSWSFYKPASGDVLTAQVSIHPKISCYLYPDDIVDRWATGIASKAMYDLLNQKGRPWTDPKASGSYFEDYERDVRRASYGNSLKTRKYFSFKAIPSATPLLPGTYGGQSGYSDVKPI